jgi:hypothetical protein
MLGARAEGVETEPTGDAVERREASAQRWLRAAFPAGARAVAGARGRWTIVLGAVQALQAGAAIRVGFPLGSTPPSLEEGPGLVTWRTSGRALVLAEIVRRRHLQLNVTGGILAAGDRVVLEYGGGDGATIQPWITDDAAAFEVSVDPTGAGTFAVDDVAWLPLDPGPPAVVHAVLPSVAGPGERVRLRLAVLDGFGNLCRDVTARAIVAGGVPSRVETVLDGGRGEVEIALAGPGVHRVDVEVPAGGLAGRSNPCRVIAAAGRVYWGDPHVHTRLSDGAGPPAFALAYAREASLLDFTAITDHDLEHYHPWFTRNRQRLSDDEWAHLARLIDAHREPGRFAILRAYEWTGRPWGDKCVYFRSDGAPIHRYEPGDADSAPALFERLRRLGPGAALAVPHTPASNFMGTRWAQHDPEIEPLVEIYSMHGASEHAGCPREMIKTVPGQHVQDALARGYRLGFVAAGDTHSSQPGNPVLGFGPYRTLRHRAGITAVMADRLDEATLFDALRARRTYATTGSRILLDVVANGAGMGQAVRSGGAALSLTARVHGTDVLEEVAVVRDGKPVHVLTPGREDCEIAWRDDGGPPDTGYCYLRVRQRDGEMAWSSPVWVERGAAS